MNFLPQSIIPVLRNSSTKFYDESSYEIDPWHEKELYRVSAFKWEDAGAGPDPSVLLIPDNMRGIIAWLQGSTTGRG